MPMSQRENGTVCRMESITVSSTHLYSKFISGNESPEHFPSVDAL